MTPLDTLWQAPMIVRLLLAGECLAAVLTLAAAQPDSRWVYFGLASLMVQWVFLSTLGAMYLLRRWLSRLSPLLIAHLSLLILLLVSVLVCMACWLVLRDFWLAGGEHQAWVLLRFVGIVLIVGLLGLAVFQNHWRNRQLAVRAKQAELEALQARIHPHFLFNTLNTGAALVHQQPEKAEQLLLDLADLFRAALAGPRQVPLGEELELARRYAEIEQLRFGARMQVQWQLPAELPALAVPTLSIQPLVENAIHHGVEPSTGVCVLGIAVEATAAQVRIEVSNDLPAAGTAQRPHHGVGLQAVRERVAAMGGRVETRSADGRYWASITLPRGV